MLKQERTRRNFKIFGSIVGIIVIGPILSIIALIVVIWWALSPRNGDIDSPEIAEPKLVAIEQQLSVELTGQDGNLVNDDYDDEGSESQYDDTDTISPCSTHGLGDNGEKYDVDRKLDSVASEDDYAAAVNLVKSLPSWYVRGADPEPDNGITTTYLEHDEVGSVVVTYSTKVSPQLSFHISSYCFAD